MLTPQKRNRLSAVIALAGRRIDLPGTQPPRFPLKNVPTVRDRLRALFLGKHARALVCSAACGADLVALEAAEVLGLRYRVVLPFEPSAFSRSSVTDRPGNWGALYDRIIETAARADDLVVLEGAGEGGAAYAAANETILRETLRLAGIALVPDFAPGGSVAPDKALGVIVWEGRSRGEDDVTERFAISARRQGLAVEEVLTV